MKLLTLIRHAKSDWADAGLTDFERPLNKRGKKNLQPMSRSLAKIHRPDLVLSSGAVRTRQTITHLCKAIEYPFESIRFDDKLYLATVGGFESVLCSVDDDFHSVYVCAHNPGITYFINRLSSANIMNVPTLGIAQIQLDIDSWTDIFTARGELLFYDFPKNHL